MSGMNKLLVVVFASILLQGSAEVTDLTTSLEHVCDVGKARWGTGSAQARSVLDLQVYHDRIFPGMGDWDHNSGPVYAMAINPLTGTCSNEYTLGTESLETIRVLADGNLYFPATDYKDGHASAGYFFRRNVNGTWYTRTSPFVDSGLSTHIWDFTEFEGRLFAAGYGIASSADRGVTWQDVNPAWKSKGERFVSFIVCGDELFARTQRSIPVNSKTGEMVDSKPTDFPYYPAIYHHWNKTSKRFDTITNSYLTMNAGLNRSDFKLSMPSLDNKATVYSHVWHATPYKNRCLYILGSASGILISLSEGYTPVGTYPAAAISGYAENGELKGQKITLESDTYPYDFIVYHDVAYLLSFKYKGSESKLVEHAVWKSTDGITFTKLFTFDFQQVMSSFEYYGGHFYFGVAFLNAQPLLGTLNSGLTDMAGHIYRIPYSLKPATRSTVTFVPNGDPDHPYELTASANWTPQAPAADDIIEIDSGNLGAATLTLAKDMEVAGLRVKNSTQNLTIAPTNTTVDPLPRLILGECGITNTSTKTASDKGIFFTVALETTEPQTWFAGKQLFSTATPFYGGHPLAIMRAYSVTHTKAPRYDGPITYMLSTLDWNQRLYLKEAAKWANAVTCTVDTAAGGNGYYQPVFSGSGEWKYTDIFPEGSSYYANYWSVQSVLMDMSGAVATYDSAAASRMKFSSADSTHIKAGTVKLESGDFLPGAVFYINGGGIFQQQGGRVYANLSHSIQCGGHSCCSMGNVTYKLEGGVCTNYATYVGGMKAEGWYLKMVGLSRFNMSGGELVVLSGGNSYAKSQALSIAPSETHGLTAPGVFTQTGGRAILNAIMFGDINGTTYTNKNAYGYANLCGGETLLTGTVGFRLGTVWNRETTTDTSNSFYRVRLAGGKLGIKSAATTKLQLEVGQGTDSSVFSNATEHTITAPVWGYGALKKRGAGNLVFRDAARLHGPLVIEQGTVSVGAYSDPKPTGSVPVADVSLRAEDITGFADGAAVPAWTNQAKTASATIAWNSTAPTFVKGGFVGYNALRFTAASKQALSFPNANIPWIGKKTMGCAVVFRTKTKGPDTAWDIYGLNNIGRGILSTASTGDNAAYGTMFLSFTSEGAVTARYNATDNNHEHPRANYNVYQRKALDIDDGEPHIAIFTSDETNLKLRTMVDGCVTEIPTTLTSTLDSGRALFIGGMNGSEPNRYFDGDIAEVRLYGSTLSRADMQAITDEWSAKYGIRPQVGRSFNDGEAPGSGLGSTNVMIAAGATLALPTGDTAGYKVTSKSVFRNEGTVTGTLELENGATLNLTWGKKAVFGTIKASGTITLNISNIPADHSNRQDLFTYTSLVGSPTFVLAGAGVNPMHDRLVVENGTCRFRTNRGAFILLR